jgi:FMN phosphatase YigB (HAD superfamily)
MIIAVDFDGTIVDSSHSYDDLEESLAFLPYAKEGLLALKRAGHTLILYSARSNPCLWEDWRLNEMWVRGIVPFHEESWEAHRALNRARYEQMVNFCERELPGVFELVYKSVAKPVSVDLFIDDRFSVTPIVWQDITSTWGESNG